MRKKGDRGEGGWNVGIGAWREAATKENKCASQCEIIMPISLYLMEY